MKKYRDFANVLICGPADHEAAVTKELDKVWGTWTGWAVLTGIIESGKMIRIDPYSAADREKIGPVNAFAKATSVTAAGPRGAALFAGADDDPRTPTDERFTPSGRTGTGTGSDCEVHFSPDVFPTPVPACGKPIVWPCALPWYAQNRYADDILCHELVHALRDALGQLDLLPTRTRGYDNQEEFFAVLVQNVFASEKGMTVFRRDHSGGARRGADATTEEFLGKGERPLSLEQLENRLLVNKLVRENRGLCNQIFTRVTAKFNPISEYMRTPALYPYDPKLAFPLRGR